MKNNIGNKLILFTVGLEVITNEVFLRPGIRYQATMNIIINIY